MTVPHRTHDLTDEIPFDDLVKELDELLEAWIASEQRARAAEAVSAREEREAA